MRDSIPVVLIALGIFVIIVGLSDDSGRQNVAKSGYIKDPCLEIHKLSMVKSRDFKPQYNRKRIKQVVLDCEEE